ncbi:MAG: glycosyl hydrolase [Chloroflexi bacterium]|nr:glycosyl hydrolase [Chloroflexota bacterium]
MNYDLNQLLKFRCIGPFRGGRVVAVAGDPVDPATFYFGACAGGVWKTEDGGIYWQNISDGYFKTAAIGALEVAPSDANVIYAGTGETAIRIDVSHGDGVYKSTNAGKSWQHMGLSDSRFIGKIRVHPQNPDLVYVAALGHAFGPNKERGVFRSKDGGKTWEHVLFRSEKAGAVDLSIDPRNPRIIYATIWEAYRSFWQISSGGPDSSLYRSLDGGDTWQEISHNKGLPKGLLGKMAVAASPAKSGRVWALIEAKNKPGLYRSDDYGDKWELMSEKGELLGRAWYFTHMTACTQDADTVYVNDWKMWKSIDGGKNFDEITTPHGDNHDLWIDPNNARRMVQGNDGGGNVSFNGGESWSSIFNQPTAQFYHVATDNQHPYHVYGTQQDNSSIAVPSRGTRGAIPWADCYPAGSGESGYIAIHPDDHNIVYVGAIGSSPGGGNSLQRYDHRTKQIRLITTWPESMWGYGASEEKYRFSWTYPIVISPHDPDVLYVTGNRVFCTTDEGQTWEILSPDLTRADPDTLKPTGGPINLDAIGAETYAVIFSFVESQHKQGVFWAGSDDGLIHLSQDGGKNWENVSPDWAEWMMVSMIEQSPHDPATVYVAGTRYKLDDYRPYLYKTTDYGQTWSQINEGIPEDAFTRVIREDPKRQGLLYVGTETGLYVSFDGGESWQSLQLNLPVSPIHDLVLKQDDLVVATHGRSFWILDDVTPLHQIDEAQLTAVAHLFQPRLTVRHAPNLFEGWAGGSPGKNYVAAFTNITTFVEEKTEEGAVNRQFLDAGENPPDGVIVTYHLQEKPEQLIHLTFLDAAGNEVKTFSSKLNEDEKREKTAEETEAEKDKIYVPANAGMNRFVWPMRHEDSSKIRGKDITASKVSGPRAVPGHYQVKLTVGDGSWLQSFEIIKDPRVESSIEDLQAQLDLWLKIRDKVSEANTAVNTIRDLQTQIDGWLKRVSDNEVIAQAGKVLKEKLAEIEKTLIVPGLKTPAEMMNHGTRLIARLASLAPVVFSADFKPTQAAQDVYVKLSGEIDAQLALLSTIIDSEAKSFNQLIQEAGIDALGH